MFILKGRMNWIISKASELHYPQSETTITSITLSNNKEHYKPITIALMLSLESRRSASSTTRFAHSSCFPYTSSHPSFPTSFNDWFTIVHTSSSERTSNTPSQQITIKRQSGVRGTERIKGSAITNSLIQLSPKLLATARRPITRLLITIPPVALMRATSSRFSAL